MTRSLRRHICWALRVPRCRRIAQVEQVHALQIAADRLGNERPRAIHPIDQLRWYVRGGRRGHPERGQVPLRAARVIKQGPEHGRRATGGEVVMAVRTRADYFGVHTTINTQRIWPTSRIIRNRRGGCKKKTGPR